MSALDCSFCDPPRAVPAVGYRIRWRIWARLVGGCHGTTMACQAIVTADVKRQLRRMLGEFLREAGVLVAVLAPLEWLMTHGALTVKGIIAIVVVAGPCLLVGMVLGLER